MSVEELPSPEIGRWVEVELQIGQTFSRTGICRQWNGQVGLCQHESEQEPSFLFCRTLVRNWRYIPNPHTIEAAA